MFLSNCSYVKKECIYSSYCIPGWRTIAILQKTKQNKKKMWEESTTSIIVKWTLNFENINFNIHSLLNENIKCVKHGWWLADENSTFLTWTGKKKNHPAPHDQVYSLYVTGTNTLIASCDSTTFLSSVSFAGIAHKNVKLEIWNPPTTHENPGHRKTFML